MFDLPGRFNFFAEADNHLAAFYPASFSDALHRNNRVVFSFYSTKKE
jgi:hypothetical protein